MTEGERQDDEQVAVACATLAAALLALERKDPQRAARVRLEIMEMFGLAPPKSLMP